MKRIAGATLLAVSLVSINGCSWLGGNKGYFRDRGSEYLDADSLPDMQLPAGMASKSLDPLLPVPAYIQAQQEKQDVQRPHPVNSSLLDGDFSIQRSGGHSWIAAQRIPAEVWNLAQAYFYELGFGMDDERPHQGEFSTSWLDESALPETARTALRLGKGQQVRYRVRIEPAAQRNSSDLFVDSAIRKGDKAGEWSTAGVTTAASGLALAGLERYFSDMGQQKQSVSLLGSERFDAPRRVTLVETEGLQVLRLDSTMDRAWSGVGRALNTAGIHVEDIDRSLGLYFVDLSRKADQREPGFFKRLFSSQKSRDKKTAAAQYRVRLSQTGQQVFVTLEQAAGELADPATTRRVLGAIQPHLN